MSDHGRGGNPRPNQEPILRAQLHRRDAQIDRQAELLKAYGRLEGAAIDYHQRTCDCRGEACEIGLALKLLSDVRGLQESRRKAHEGVDPLRRL